MKSIKLVLFVLLVGVSSIRAQEVYPEGHSPEVHAFYQGWVNKADQGCCNDQDCRPIKAEDVRLSPVTMVRIEDEWCQVFPTHYLKEGNAPAWDTAHVCVQPPYVDDLSYSTEESAKQTSSVCARLLCFQPPPLF